VSSASVQSGGRRRARPRGVAGERDHDLFRGEQFAEALVEDRDAWRELAVLAVEVVQGLGDRAGVRGRGLADLGCSPVSISRLSLAQALQYAAARE